MWQNLKLLAHSHNCIHGQILAIIYAVHVNICVICDMHTANMLLVWLPSAFRAIGRCKLRMRGQQWQHRQKVEPSMYLRRCLADLWQGDKHNKMRRQQHRQNGLSHYVSIPLPREFVARRCKHKKLEGISGSTGQKAEAIMHQFHCLADLWQADINKEREDSSTGTSLKQLCTYVVDRGRCKQRMRSQQHRQKPEAIMSWTEGDVNKELEGSSRTGKMPKAIIHLHC